MGATGTLKKLFEYKAWANDTLLGAMTALDRDAPSTEVALRVLNHTYIVDRIFAAQMQRSGHGYRSANDPVAPILAELSQAIRASDQWYVDYVATLEAGELAESLDFSFTDGDPGRMTREEMLMHLISHGDYHRGQIGWIMTMDGVDPQAGGLTTYLHKAEAATRRRVPVAVVEPAPILSTPPAELPGKAGSRLDELTDRIRIAVGTDAGLGKSLKFNLKGEGFVFIEGGTVSNEDKPADLTLTVTIDDLKALGKGKLSPMGAVMTGRLGLSDMGVATGLLGKMRELLSRMP